MKNPRVDIRLGARHSDGMKKPVKKKPAKKRPAKLDFSQSALAGVEKLIGGKLVNGMKRD